MSFHGILVTVFFSVCMMYWHCRPVTGVIALTISRPNTHVVTRNHVLRNCAIGFAPRSWTGPVPPRVLGVKMHKDCYRESEPPTGGSRTFTYTFGPPQLGPGPPRVPSGPRRQVLDPHVYCPDSRQGKRGAKSSGQHALR